MGSAAAALPTVAQEEMGVPLSRMSSVRTREAVRPDGSRVWIEAVYPDADPQAGGPAADAPAPVATPTGSAPDVGTPIVEAAEPEPAEAAVDTDPQAAAVDVPTAAAPAAPAAEVEVPYVAPRDYAHAGGVTVPSGERARVRANIEVLALLAELDDQNRYAAAAEQQVLARWSGWGGCPTVFDETREDWGADRAAVRELLTDDEYRAAKRSILNAHYTDPAVAAVMWEALAQAGFDGGRVLEPGCGAGVFIGLAPADATMVGVELDPASARVAHYLYPSAQIRNEGFEGTRVGDGSFTATVGNVPFGDFVVPDPLHNTGRHSIHNHFIVKALHLTAPGGYAALITSRYTLDALDDKARRDMHQQAELVGAFRLPARAFARVAATAVVTDVLVFRRRAEGEAIAHPDTVDWLHAEDTLLRDAVGRWQEVPMNRYFARNPGHVIGDLGVGSGMYAANTLRVDHEDVARVPDELAAVMTPVIAAARARGAGLTARAAGGLQSDAPAPGIATAEELYEDEAPVGRVDYDELTGEFYRRAATGRPEPVKVFRNRAAETRHLLRLRTLAESAITSQRRGIPLAQRGLIRDELNRVYDAYVATYGPINRVKLQGGKERTPEQAARRLAEAEAKWRHENRDRETGAVYEGPLPDDLAAEMEEQAWTASPLVRRQVHLEALRGDPGVALLTALEQWDDETGRVAGKAAIFSRDVVVDPPRMTSAQSPEEALAITVGESGSVDLDRIAELLGTSPGDAREQVRGLVFPDPRDPEHRLTPATSVLSGHVLSTIERIAELRATDPEQRDWDELHAALTAVLPPRKGPGQIGEVGLGATWVTTDDYAAFARETFGIASVQVDHSSAGWVVHASGAGRFGPRVQQEYGVEVGTNSVDAVKLYEALLNQRPIVVKNSAKDREDGAPEIDGKATTLVQVQSRKITAEFRTWLWDDEDRRERLMAEWNRRFNSGVAPRHDGRYLTLPDVSPAFTPHPYQRNAVARVVAEPTVLFDHVVGAGKTGSMLMSAMELKRRGLTSQPWIVVPTHLIEQFGREARQWLPAANVLVGRKGMDAEDRRLLVAQSATSDWDMVIVPSSVFELINVAPDRQKAYVRAQLDDLDTEFWRLRQNDKAPLDRTIKALERMKVRLEDRMAKLINAEKKENTNSLVTFEQSGCSYVFIDEAHEYKNKGRVSSIETLSHTGSQKAEDLAMKLALLREREQDRARAAGRTVTPGAERVATFSTGTPIANSLAESWVMQQYLRPDVLDAAGVRSINDWAASFTTTRTETVTNTTGTKLKVVTQVSAFLNPREMFALSAQYTDVVTRDQVPAELPRHGGREIVTVAAGQQLRDFTADLEFRLDHLDPQRPDLDNVLKVLSDGRNAALDPRLANLAAPEPGASRAHAVAEKVAEVYFAAVDLQYPTETGAVSETRGALQLVFCDRGTPKPGGAWSFYDAMRDAMIDRGVPGEKIAFIHDAKTAVQRNALQAACRAGRVSVLIGSTPKMGTGVNVQQRLIALHHADVPWRPADLEQREGRIIRQGNKNPQVRLFNYVSEASTDTVMWQKVESKATFIEQAKNGQLDESLTSVEDIAEESLSAAAAATKAAATGDQRFIALVESEEQLKELRALDGAHREARRTAQRIVRDADRAIPALEAEIEAVTAIVGEHRERFDRWAEQGKRFTVDGRAYPERTDRSAALVTRARAVWAELKGKGPQTSAVIATFPGDVDVRMSRFVTNDGALLWLDLPGRPDVMIDEAALWQKRQATLLDTDTARDDAGSALRSGFATRVENLYARLPGRITRAHYLIADHREALAINADRIDAQFPDADRLAELELTVMQLRTDIAAERNSPEAIAKREADEIRMAAAGREPGWSLDLNPTKVMLDDSQFDSAREFVAAVQRMQVIKARAWTRDHDPKRSPTPSRPAPLAPTADPYRDRGYGYDGRPRDRGAER